MVSVFDSTYRGVIGFLRFFAIVNRSEWKLNPFAGHLFVFFGRRLDRVKILVWDRNGFVLYYKRLSQGRFRMPTVPADATRVELDATTLAMLLDGIDVKHVRRPTHWTPSTELATAP